MWSSSNSSSELLSVGGPLRGAVVKREGLGAGPNMFSIQFSSGSTIVLQAENASIRNAWVQSLEIMSEVESSEDADDGVEYWVDKRGVQWCKDKLGNVGAAGAVFYFDGEAWVEDEEPPVRSSISEEHSELSDEELLVAAPVTTLQSPGGDTPASHYPPSSSQSVEKRLQESSASSIESVSETDEREQSSKGNVDAHVTDAATVSTHTSLHSGRTSSSWTESAEAVKESPGVSKDVQVNLEEKVPVSNVAVQTHTGMFYAQTSRCQLVVAVTLVAFSGETRRGCANCR